MNTTPYWQQSAALPEFESLSRDVEVDVVIIGAGLTGITTAYLLKRAGAKVALLDRQRCAAADTAHTTAHLTYVTDKRLHALVSAFGRDAAKAFWEAGIAAIDQISDVVRELKIDCEFAWTPGFLHGRLKGHDERDCESLEKDAALAQELDFDARFLKETPYANRPGVRFENQAKFHPLKYLARLLAEIPGDGSYIFENTTAFEIDEKPLAVHAGNHRIRCQYLVIATHNPLVGKSGMMSATLFQTKLALYTSYVVAARLPRGRVPAALFWDTSDPYYYLRVDSRPDHDLAIFGGRDVKTGQEQDATIVFRELEADLQEQLPEAQVEYRWLGQVIETDDGLPFIGENAGSQFIATGFCGNGFTLGTLSASMARDRYLGRKNPWFELFRVDRKKFHGGAWRYLSENLDYPYYLLRDRLARSESGTTDELQRGEGRIIKVNGKKTAAFRGEDGRVSLLSPVCTHLKCIVRWNPADKTWDCPCHGSRFKPDGEVLSGPAESPLEKMDSK